MSFYSFQRKSDVNPFSKLSLWDFELNSLVIFIAIYLRDPVCLVTRLQQLLGVKLYSSAKEKLQYLFRHSPERAEQLSVEDIEQRDVRVKHLNCIFYAQGRSFESFFYFTNSHLFSFCFIITSLTWVWFDSDFWFDSSIKNRKSWKENSFIGELLSLFWNVQTSFTLSTRFLFVYVW